jgi:hypothetical protein
MRVTEQEYNQFSVGRWIAHQNDHFAGPRANAAPLKPAQRLAAADGHARDRAGKPQQTGARGRADGQPFQAAGKVVGVP